MQDGSVVLLKRLLAVPIMVGGELWGVVDLEEIRPEAFDDDDARLVQALADQIGLALRGAPPC